jgi:hypothetical protein
MQLDAARVAETILKSFRGQGGQVEILANWYQEMWLRLATASARDALQGCPTGLGWPKTKGD